MKTNVGVCANVRKTILVVTGNTLAEHKLWEDKVDKIIKSSDSEETKERERQKVLELIGKVDKSEKEFEVFREMFQQVFLKASLPCAWRLI